VLRLLDYDGKSNKVEAVCKFCGANIGTVIIKDDKKESIK
jgi:hypothetical protein